MFIKKLIEALLKHNLLLKNRKHKILNHLKKIYCLILSFSPYLISFFLTLIAVYKILPHVSKSTQKYFDISVDILITQDLNKTGELYFFWALMFFSVLITVSISYLQSHLICFSSTESKKIKPQVHNFTKYLIIFGIPLLTSWKIGSEISFSLVALFMLALIIILLLVDGFLIILLTCFVYHASLSIICFLGWQVFFYAPPADNLILISLVFSLMLQRLFSKVLIKKVILFVQIPIPLLLLYFLIDRYDFNGVTEYVTFSKGYKSFFFILIGILFLASIYQVKRVLNNDLNSKISTSILLSSVISIFVFYSYSSPALFFPTDLHHSGESFATWDQLKNHGKVLYETYILPSGLFSIFNGVIHNYFLGGGVTDYGSLVTLLRAFWSALLIVLVYIIFNAEIALIISLLVSISNYDRTFTLLPFILILMLPALIRKRHLWLQTFLLLSLIQYFYYSLYGVAFFIGGLPMCVLQIFQIWKTNGTKFRDSIKAFIGWLILVILLLVCMPLVEKMFTHSMLYASQTTLADGIAIFGRGPNDFLNFIRNDTLRTALLYTSIISVPIISVLILIDLLSKLVLRSNFDDKLKKPGFLILPLQIINNWQSFITKEFFGLSSSLIILIMTYQYSLNRLDFGTITARSGPVITLLIGILVPCIVLKYSKQIVGKHSIWKYAVVGFSFSLANNFNNYKLPSQPLNLTYKIPNGFIKINPDTLQEFPRAGNGFIHQDTLTYLKNLNNQVKEYQNVGLSFTNLGYIQYYVLGLDNSATSTFYIAKTKETQSKIISILNKDMPVIGPLDSFMSSYIYKWAIGKGYTSDKNGFLLPPGYKSHTPIETQNDFSKAFYFSQNGFYASSLGRSYENLSPNLDNREVLTQFTRTALPFTVTFEKPILGKDIDFVMLKLSSSQIINTQRYEPLFTNNEIGNQSKIMLEFTVDRNGVLKTHSITASYGKGILLLPMFANWLWLDGKIISINVKSAPNSISDIIINDIKFFHWSRFDDLG